MSATVFTQRLIELESALSKQPLDHNITSSNAVPRDQLQTLYSQNGKQPTTKSSSPTNTASKKSAASAAKPKIPDALVAPKKPSSSAATKPRHKNLEAAIAALNTGELESLLATYRTSYPDSHLHWLKAVVELLNARLSCDTDPTFAGRSPNYPANIVPPAVRELIVGTLREAGETNVQHFFEQLLNSLVVDQSKGLPVVGYRIVAQLTAFEWPQVGTRSLARTAILRNSYQNRAPIGLGLLWAVGQGGFRDVSAGVRVWQNLVLPVLEQRAYTRFACEYVLKVLQRAADGQLLDLSAEETVRAYDELTAQRTGVAKEQQQQLAEAAALLLGRYVQSNQRCTALFVPLFKRYGAAEQKPAQQQAIGAALVECLQRDADCLKAWRINFRKHAAESNQLLRTLSKSYYLCCRPFFDARIFDAYIFDHTGGEHANNRGYFEHARRPAERHHHAADQEQGVQRVPGRAAPAAGRDSGGQGG